MTSVNLAVLFSVGDRKVMVVWVDYERIVRSDSEVKVMVTGLVGVLVWPWEVDVL